jgi:hypothetical protein
MVFAARNLMAPDEFKNLGFAEDDKVGTAAEREGAESSSSSSSSLAATETDSKAG